jgi:FlaA1/EpsC-like NDP-sugar epimerase
MTFIYKKKVKMMDSALLNTLLDREFLVADQNSLDLFLKDKTILITGGGGTVGSELCRQISKLNPKKIVILDNYENGTYEIQQEILYQYGGKFELVTTIASIKDSERVNDIFDKHKPDIVFHAAAYKHLSLMEDNPLEAVRTNIFGTMNIVNACDKHNVDKMIFTSTDKAVNPECIMGFTKRIAEKYINYINCKSCSSFSSVRFGNVLGSNGSVFSLFEKQIKLGGPITITHPDITRYFMTIQEAASLILLAGSEMKGGEIFILDMKEPVKIVDMACRFASLFGYTVGKDIHISFVGLKKGEKINEELFFNEENINKCSTEGIFWVEEMVGDMDCYFDNLSKFKVHIDNDYNHIKKLLRGMI